MGFLNFVAIFHKCNMQQQKNKFLLQKVSLKLVILIWYQLHTLRFDTSWHCTKFIYIFWWATNFYLRRFLTFMSVDNNWKYVWYNETLPHSSETKIFMLDFTFYLHGYCTIKRYIKFGSILPDYFIEAWISYIWRVTMYLGKVI